MICSVGDGDEDDIQIDPRETDTGGSESALKQRGRGLAFRCAPAQACTNYSVEWFLDGKLLISGSFFVNGSDDEILNSDLVAWSHDRLWTNRTGPWTRSRDGCLSCRTEGCGVEEKAELCGAGQPAQRNASPAFSFFWYVLYALFIVYMTN